MTATLTEMPRLGVTLVSYSREYVSGAMSLAACLEEVGRLSDRALELTGAQSLRGYPRPTPESEREVRELIDRFGLDPVAYDAYVERGRRAGRVATVEEAAESIEVEMGIAHRLGFRILRLNTATPALLTRLLPVAERTKMTIAVELHAQTIESPAMQALLDLFVRVDSPRLGFLQDLGAMMVRLPESFLQEGLRTGVPAHVVEAVQHSWADGAPTAETLACVRELGAGPAALGWAGAACAMFIRTAPGTLRAVLPHLVHVHGKFFGLDADGEEPCIPYGEIVGILREAGYRGVIASEYLSWEPLHRLDSAAQVAAHHDMIRRLWGGSPSALLGSTTQRRTSNC